VDFEADAERAARARQGAQGVEDARGIE